MFYIYRANIAYELTIVVIQKFGQFSLECKGWLLSPFIYWDKIGEQDNYTVQAILLPQKVQGKVTIQARMNGYLYEAEFANLTEQKSGFSYNYIIKTNKYEDNNYVLTITEQTQIIGWEDENHDPITSDPSIAETGTEITNPSWNITEETVTPQPVVK